MHYVVNSCQSFEPIEGLHNCHHKLNLQLKYTFQNCHAGEKGFDNLKMMLGNHEWKLYKIVKIIISIVDCNKLKRKPIFTCFIDFKKAYDSVWREGLFYKLLLCGCSKSFLKCIVGMYSSVRYSVKLEDGTKPFSNWLIGVRQGCNLSPTLFNIFINDVPNLFDDSCDPVKLGNTNLNCLLYADDLVLLSESQKGLQSCLTKLERYTNRWKLNINTKNSKFY